MRWCWLYPCLLGLHSGKHLSEGGIRLIWCLALFYSFGGCHQCKSNPANLLPYGLAGAVLGCFVDITVIMRLVSANQQGTCFLCAYAVTLLALACASPAPVCIYVCVFVCVLVGLPCEYTCVYIQLFFGSCLRISCSCVYICVCACVLAV